MKITMTGNTCILIMFLCAVVSAGYAETTHPVELQVEISPGREYTHTKWFTIVPVKLTPQIACWVEGADSSFVAPIYVTEKAAIGSWRGEKDVRRPEALPVFFHEIERVGATVKADAVSGATPKKGSMGSSSFSQGLHLVPGSYRVMLEVNSSFDYNESYPKREGDVNGQPSMLYSGEFRIDETGRVSHDSIFLDPVGHGDPSGKSGTVSSGIGSLTSALEQIERIHVSIIK